MTLARWIHWRNSHDSSKGVPKPRLSKTISLSQAREAQELQRGWQSTGEDGPESSLKVFLAARMAAAESKFAE